MTGGALTRRGTLFLLAQAAPAGQGLAGQEVRDWLCGLPLGQDSEVQVAWIADRLGARMSFAAFASNVSDLWFPAMDDIVCVLRSGGNLAVLVLDHEELITLSSVNPPAAEGGHPGTGGAPVSRGQIRLLAVVAEGAGTGTPGG